MGHLKGHPFPTHLIVWSTIFCCQIKKELFDIPIKEWSKVSLEINVNFKVTFIHNRCNPFLYQTCKSKVRNPKSFFSLEEL